MYPLILQALKMIEASIKNCHVHNNELYGMGGGLLIMPGMILGRIW